MPEHVSDEVLEGVGETFEEALLACASRLVQLMQQDSICEEETRPLCISVPCADEECCVVDFLNEIIARCEEERVVPTQILSLSRTETGLSANIAVCRGVLVNPVKAATYHDLLVERNGKWKIRVLVDV